MENITGKKYWLFLIVSLLLVGGFYLIKPEPVKAGSEDNLSGWAYASNIGWVSFNALNCAIPGTCIGDSCISDGHLGCPHVGDTYRNYGVNINSSTGKFSGRAWSSNIGFISFNRIETGAPPKEDPCPDGSCVAEIEDGSTPSSCGSGCLITGWARALSHADGWDGWIRLNGQITNGGSYEVILNTSNNQFHGYAWGGDPEGVAENSVVGWLSWNCNEGGLDEFGNTISVCGASDYKVVYNPSNDAPSASNLTKASTILCSVTPNAQITFEWTYTDPDGDDQTQYYIQVDNNSDFSSPEKNTTVPQTVASGGTGTSGIYVITVDSPDTIKYNSSIPYYWRIKVYDGQIWSGWFYSSSSFRTPSNALPGPYISVDNNKPEIGEEVTFSDFNGENDSTCWNTNNNSYDCRDNSNNRYIWEIYEGAEHTLIDRFDTNDNSEYRGSINYSFDSMDSYTVQLTIEDQSYVSNDSHSGQCPTEMTINAGMPKPEWKEIPPFGKLLNGIKDTFANISNFFNKIFSI